MAIENTHGTHIFHEEITIREENRVFPAESLPQEVAPGRPQQVRQ
jgi:hypothetical protein